MIEGDGRVVLVTGGASGIGLAIVRRFLSEGCRVAFVARHKDRVAEVLESLQACNTRLLAEAVDVTRRDDMAQFLARVQDHWGDIEVLVNNAGISPKRTDPDMPWLAQTSPEEWAKVIDVNLSSAFALMRLVAPPMIAQHHGRIINIGSLAGRTMPLIAGPHYAASKAGLVGLTRAAARDLAPYAITVNCIAPGRILGGMTGLADSPVNRTALARIPLGRFGTVEEIANVAIFLASPSASFVTGATIDVTGGEFAA
jgi:3-oxoacyl-[acyl-carrier protein] reductase